MGRIPRAMYRKFAHILMYVWCSNEREETRHTGPLGGQKTYMLNCRYLLYIDVLYTRSLSIYY